MKRSLFALLLWAATAAAAAAQTPTTAPAPTSTAPTADRRLQRLSKELNLSAEQQTRLVPILEAQRQEVLALREKVKAEGRQPGMGRSLKAAQEKYLGQIQAVLTPEQFAHFSQLQDQQRNALRERRQGNAAADVGLD